MKLILVRHAKSEGNEAETMEGREGKLSREGIIQAKKLGLQLKEENINVIYSSPFVRARETVDEIVKHYPGILVNYVDELRECDLGETEGKKYSDIDWSNLPEDYESKESLYKRAKKILETVCKKHSEETVLFVAHGVINKALLRFVLYDSPGSKVKFSQDNAAISVFEIGENNKRKIRLINCTEHLN